MRRHAGLALIIHNGVGGSFLSLPSIRGNAR
ncbi:hypothetical protein C4K35_2694 [Pseudomonas chlororaphis subsp. piscium]|nr:hypothetical protein C4K35_2694 [Pseudomonas chlororaphis subsp. piscium]AZC56859.1 hypothetical protein C4K34_2694 [Pseudomonas chlororaphis subsp. piscium]AZC63085.1 hypothetical protein C4K33_2593 [Pseudomonas chlororaphis subsp. piscium]AZC69316.1 hypothetical protein C4K32_2654 [Pseudomonas chlororaphis subsp. piscium]AZC75494.1 hypothetical protein C4K31_2591 [Pseudomonas chlororaphis subsp. piscium]